MRTQVIFYQDGYYSCEKVNISPVDWFDWN